MTRSIITQPSSTGRKCGVLSSSRKCMRVCSISEKLQSNDTQYGCDDESFSFTCPQNKVLSTITLAYGRWDKQLKCTSKLNVPDLEGTASFSAIDYAPCDAGSNYFTTTVNTNLWNTIGFDDPLPGNIKQWAATPTCVPAPDIKYIPSKPSDIIANTINKNTFSISWLNGDTATDVNIWVSGFKIESNTNPFVPMSSNDITCPYICISEKSAIISIAPTVNISELFIWISAINSKGASRFSCGYIETQPIEDKTKVFTDIKSNDPILLVRNEDNPFILTEYPEVLLIKGAVSGDLSTIKMALVNIIRVAVPTIFAADPKNIITDLPPKDTQEPPPKVDCDLTSWSQWSECSGAECDQEGTQTRSRTIKTPASNNGVACGDTNETRNCIMPACPK
jgi:hypothetical protein